MRTAFDRDRLVDDVAFDTRRRGQPHFQPAHAADHASVHNDIVGNDFAPNRRGLADRQQMRADVAFDRAFDLDIATGLQVADNRQIRGQNRSRRLGLRRRGGVVRGALRLVFGRFRALGLAACLGTGFVYSAFRKHLAPP